MLHVITAYETLAAFECERVIIDLPAFVHERVTIRQPARLPHAVWSVPQVRNDVTSSAAINKHIGEPPDQPTTAALARERAARLFSANAE